MGGKKRRVAVEQSEKGGEGDGLLGDEDADFAVVGGGQLGGGIERLKEGVGEALVRVVELVFLKEESEERKEEGTGKSGDG